MAIIYLRHRICTPAAARRHAVLRCLDLLSCLEEERHQVRHTLVVGGENIQNRPLDLALLVLALSS